VTRCSICRMWYNSHSDHMQQMHSTTLSNYEANMVVAKLRAEVERLRVAMEIAINRLREASKRDGKITAPNYAGRNTRHTELTMEVDAIANIMWLALRNHPLEKLYGLKNARAALDRK
jgi:hypothetical protein